MRDESAGRVFGGFHIRADDDIVPQGGGSPDHCRQQHHQYAAAPGFGYQPVDAGLANEASHNGDHAEGGAVAPQHIAPGEVAPQQRLRPQPDMRAWGEGATGKGVSVS